MKRTLLCCLLSMVLSGVVMGQSAVIGMSPDLEPWNVWNTNIDPGGEPFDVYLVVMADGLYSVGGYELELQFSSPSVFLLSVDGPNGWTNFGSNMNHLCGYTTPLPLGADGEAVLSTLTLLYTSPEDATISVGPSNPSSVDDAGPAVVNGIDLDQVIACEVTYAYGGYGPVLTLNGEGIYSPFAVESRSWSDVKRIFD